MSQLIKDIAAHLAKQREQSKLVRSTTNYCCAYRGEGKTMCAVGCLIPDEIYHPIMEGMSIGSIFGAYSQVEEHIYKKYGVTEGPESEAVYRSLRRAQRYHDSYRYTHMIQEFAGRSDEEFAQAIEETIMEVQV